MQKLIDIGPYKSTTWLYRTSRFIYLFSYGREFEHMQGFIKHTGTLIHIDYHVDMPLSTEKILEEASQLAVSEGNNLWIISTKWKLSNNYDKQTDN